MKVIFSELWAWFVDLKEHQDQEIVVYGAFKPDFNNKQAFDQYWEGEFWTIYPLGTTMEPAYSVWTDKHILVDYIWYQSDYMKVLRVLDIPSIYQHLQEFQTFPNEVVPSDHIPMVADFYID